MITAYHRPHSVHEALALMNRATPVTLPLGGGTFLSHGVAEGIEVVDLQSLGLDRIMTKGNDLEIGATATLQSLLEHSSCPASMRVPLKLEAPLNIRNAATVAGTLVTCNGRSTLSTALLALDARLTVHSVQPPGVAAQKGASARSQGAQNLGDFLPLRPAGLITKVTVPLHTRLAFQYVARTPTDKPIVCVALAQWPSGRTRLAVGGFGPAPSLALDGTESAGIEIAARNAFHDANDEWGSAEYRMDVAATLAARCLSGIAP